MIEETPFDRLLTHEVRNEVKRLEAQLDKCHASAQDRCRTGDADLALIHLGDARRTVVQLEQARRVLERKETEDRAALLSVVLQHVIGASARNEGGERHLDAARAALRRMGAK